MSRDRSWNDGDKLSFSERDRRRREGGGRDEGRQPDAGFGQEQASSRYLKKLDGLFAKPTAERSNLEASLRAAHGTAGLVDACRAYRDALGFPSQPALIGMFLDSDDSELMIGVLDWLHGQSASGEELEMSGGLRSQLRMLIDGRDSVVAGLAEDLLAAL
jgi:hypothetical protein